MGVDTVDYIAEAQHFLDGRLRSKYQKKNPALHQILTSHKQNCAVQKLMPMLEQIDNFTNGGLDNKLLALMAQPPKKKAKRATKKTYCSSHIFHEEEAPTPEKPQRKTNSPAFDCWPVVADCSHTDTVERDLREDIYDDFCKYYHFRKRLIENPKSLYTRKETISKFCKTLDDIPRVGMSKQEKNLLLDAGHVEEVLNGPLADLEKTHNKYARRQILEKRKYLNKVFKAKEGYALI